MEAHPMRLKMQDSFLGKSTISGNLYDRLTYILTEYPEARDSYMLAIFRFWMELEGLDEVLGDKADAFKRWFVRQATSPKTIQNRIGELQSRHPELEASPEVERQRQRQAKQGRVL